MRFARPFALLSLAASVAACGSLSSHTDDPSQIATVRGELVNPGAVVVEPDALRVAIVWTLFGSTTTLSHAAQDVAVKSGFPAQFELDLTDPPPATAMMTSNVPEIAGLRYAYGTIVAYEDRNHDGALDIVDPTATDYVDRIVAADPLLTITYFEGAIPDRGTAPDIYDDSGNGPKPGFNLLHSDPSRCGAPADAGRCEGFDWESIDTPISLSLSDDPRFSGLMCSVDPGNGSTASGGAASPGQLPSTFPAANDPRVHCAADGRSYTYEGCVVIDHGVCKGAETSCTNVSYSLANGQTPPAGWPCPTH